MKRREPERSIVSVIKTEAEYQELLQELESLLVLDPPSGTLEDDRLELLLLLVKDYDAKYFKFGPIDPILFRMDQQGLTRNDLIPYLGSRSKVSEVLNRKRPLSLRMIRALHAGLGIPLDILIQEPSPVQREQSINGVARVE
jgi:HTH-type transcriptional regulator/antitoxin HigA